MESGPPTNSEGQFYASKLSMLEDHLAQAERHVAEGERILQQQRETIEGRGDGVDPEAKRLLSQLEDVQRLHLAGRDRLREEVDAARAVSGSA
jgi:hypothetical protein